jgi:micrococcal nuclease
LNFKKINKINFFYLLIVVLGTIYLPLLSLPILSLWWLYKKSKFSKKFKILLTNTVIGLFIFLIALSLALHNNSDPQLSITEPSANLITEENQITIKGTLKPDTGKVWINDIEIKTDNGRFEYLYSLTEGENKIIISAGDIKKLSSNLIVFKNRAKKEINTITKTILISPTPTKVIQITKTPQANTPTVIMASPTRDISKVYDHEYMVTKIIDGDTIQIEGNRVVRYIGIDTPETVDPRKTVQCFGKQASEENNRLVLGKKIKLVKDVSETDKYGRLLRYVYVDNLFVNEYLVRQGFAYASPYQPDIKYQNIFKEAEKDAKTNNRGLWSSCQSNNSPTKTTTQKSNNNSGSNNYSCDGKTKCGQMNSCEEAYFYLNSCGLDRLDGDSDGVPCETIC